MPDNGGASYGTAGLLFVQLVFHDEQIARIAPEEQKC